MKRLLILAFMVGATSALSAMEGSYTDLLKPKYKTMADRARESEGTLDILKLRFDAGNLTVEDIKENLLGKKNYNVLENFGTKNGDEIKSYAQEILEKGDEATDQEVANAIAGMTLLYMSGFEYDIERTAGMVIKKLKALKK